MAGEVDPDEVKLEVTLEATGEQIFQGIESYRISSSFLTPTDSWEFVIFDEDDPAGLRTKFRPWQPISLWVGGQTQVLGRIEKIEGVGESGAALKVSGYDYLHDIVAGGVDPAIQIKKEMDLGQAILEIFKPYGITQVFGDFNLTRNILTGRAPFKGKPKRNFKAAHPDELRPGDNEGAFEFAEKIVARHGFTIQPAGTRDAVCICGPHDLSDPMYDVKRPGNVLRASASRDWGSVPTVTVARGRGGDPNVEVVGTRHEFATFENDTVTPIAKIPEIQRTITSDDGVSIVRQVRFDPKKGDPNTIYGFNPPVYRPLFYHDKDSKNQEQLEFGVKKMVADKLKSTLEYSCTLRGHVDPVTGAIWSIDTVANVLDGIEQVNERMWLYERDLYNDGQGPMADLKLMRPDSYQL